VQAASFDWAKRAWSVAQHAVKLYRWGV
jgi:hypothetical protein